MNIINSPLDRFRLIAIMEGISFLLLLCVAMPIKYIGGNPLPVKYFGWAHGLLFMLFLIVLLQVWIEEKWSFGKVAVAFLSSLAPIAPFLFERRLRRELARKNSH